MGRRVHTYDNRPFLVSIDREGMERRYVLEVIHAEHLEPACGPLTAEEFRRRFGFSETWPHEEVRIDTTTTNG